MGRAQGTRQGIAVGRFTGLLGERRGDPHELPLSPTALPLTAAVRASALADEFPIHHNDHPQQLLLAREFTGIEHGDLAGNEMSIWPKPGVKGGWMHIRVGQDHVSLFNGVRSLRYQSGALQVSATPLINLLVAALRGHDGELDGVSTTAPDEHGFPSRGPGRISLTAAEHGFTLAFATSERQAPIEFALSPRGVWALAGYLRQHESPAPLPWGESQSAQQP